MNESRITKQVLKMKSLGDLVGTGVGDASAISSAAVDGYLIGGEGRISHLDIFQVWDYCVVLRDFSPFGD